MKILIVSWYFPPVNLVGALRVGRFARYLTERGHQVGVVAGSGWGMPETLPLGVELDRLAYARCRDVNAPVRLGSGLWTRLTGRESTRAAAAGAQVAAPEPGQGDAGGSRPALLRRLSDAYTNLLNVPDQRIGWYPDAVRQVMRLARGWCPDVLYASGPSFTAFAACARASKRLGVPWIAEFRDRWADDPYDLVPAWRARLDHWVERRVLASAAGVVTVSEPWAEFYRTKYDKPVELVYNGYDPDDFPGDPDAPVQSGTEAVRILYTGGIYPGRRDPTPLFEALRLLGTEAEKVVVEFYGSAPELVWPLAERSGVSHLVRVNPSVPHRESLRLQWNADVLLLMQWNDPREQGNCPAKLFEYLASLRPILVLGYDQGVPASFVRGRAAGAVSTDPATIAGHLRGWIRDKAAHGAVPRLPAAVRDGLARDRQFARAEAFIARLAGAAPGPT